MKLLLSNNHNGYYHLFDSETNEILKIVSFSHLDVSDIYDFKIHRFGDICQNDGTVLFLFGKLLFILSYKIETIYNRIYDSYLEVHKETFCIYDVKSGKEIETVKIEYAL